MKRNVFQVEIVVDVEGRDLLQVNSLEGGEPSVGDQDVRGRCNGRGKIEFSELGKCGPLERADFIELGEAQLVQGQGSVDGPFPTNHSQRGSGDGSQVGGLVEKQIAGDLLDGE